MPQPYPWLATERFEYSTDWAECVGDTQPGDGCVFSSAAQEATLVGYVPGLKLRSALSYFLGLTTCDEESPYLLHRYPPARHPLHPQLYCHSIGAKGLGPKATAGQPLYQTSPFLGHYGETLKYGEYEKYLLTLRFKSYARMLFLPDSELAEETTPYTAEYKRYTRITMGPAVQALTADGSSNLVFREGSGASAPTPDVTAFPAPVAELMAKSNVSIEWLGVPHEYLTTNRYYLKPDKIIARLGGVNDATFIGLEKGTFLLTAAQFDTSLFPITPSDPLKPFTGWDVTLTGEHFDPEKGVPASEYRGHRVFPYRVDGKWYYASRESSSRELLPLVNMAKVFQHISDAS